MTAASFVGFTGFTLVMPFLARYIQELGVTDLGEVALWTGITLGVTPAVTALCAPLWGRVGDRFGNKLLVQRSLASCVVVMGLMAYATRPWHLFALRAVQGLVAGYGPLTISMAALSAPPEHMARAIGAVQTAQRIGPAIGPVFGGLLAAAVGLRNSFLVSAAVYAGAFVMVTIMYTEPARVPRKAGEVGRVSFGTVLAFENFLLLMVVIFGLQVVDRSFGPILLLARRPAWIRIPSSGCARRDAVLRTGRLWRVRPSGGRRAAEAWHHARSHRGVGARRGRDARGVRGGDERLADGRHDRRLWRGNWHRDDDDVYRRRIGGPS